MKKDIIVLGCRQFMLYKKLFTPNIDTRRAVWDVYKNPSNYKLSVYADWVTWLNNCSEDCNDFITIDSYSNQRFNLSGVVTINGEKYVIKITPSHNCCAKVSH